MFRGFNGELGHARQLDDLAEYAVGDEQFSVTHDLLVDRLRFLPNKYSRRRPSDPGPSRVRGSGLSN